MRTPARLIPLRRSLISDLLDGRRESAWDGEFALSLKDTLFDGADLAGSTNNLERKQDLSAVSRMEKMHVTWGLWRGAIAAVAVGKDATQREALLLICSGELGGKVCMSRRNKARER